MDSLQGYDGTHLESKPRSDPGDRPSIGGIAGIIAVIGLAIFVAGMTDEAAHASAQTSYDGSSTSRGVSHTGLIG